MKFLKYLAYFEIIGCIGLAIGLIVMGLVSELEHPTIYLRGLIIVPFGLWWGFRELRKVKIEEAIKRLNENPRANKSK